MNKCLIICGQDISKTDAGNHRRINSILKNLKKLNLHIVLLNFWKKNVKNQYVDDFYNHKNLNLISEEDNKIFNKVKINSYKIEKNMINDIYIKLAIALHRKYNFKYVVCEYIMTSRIFFYLNNITKIIDTHDVFYEKQKMLKYGINVENITQEMEENMLNRSDYIICISDYDKSLFNKLNLNNNLKLITCGLSKEDFCNSILSSKIKENSLLIVASNTIINKKCIKLFINKCFNRLKNYHLTIIGGITKHIKEQENINLIEYCDDNELKNIISSTKFIINPVFLGTGLKIKSLEAIVNNKFLITFDEGVKGMPKLGYDYFKSCKFRNFKLMKNTIEKYNRNNEKYINIVGNTKKFTNEYLNNDKVYLEFNKIFND